MPATVISRHGRYTVMEISMNAAPHFEVARPDHFICRAFTREDAERIAYCLTVVEQSEETARRDEGAQS